jgi:hypothetical protein
MFPTNRRNAGRRLLGYARLILALGILTTPFGARATGSTSEVDPAMTVDWWQWAVSIPTSVHPLRTDPTSLLPDGSDKSSRFCMVGQHGKLWHLGGSFLQVVSLRVV